MNKNESIDIDGRSMKDIANRGWNQVMGLVLAKQLWNAYKKGVFTSKNRNSLKKNKKAVAALEKLNKSNKMRNKKIQGTGLTLSQLLKKINK